MAPRALPARPDLEHLKHEAKALRRAFLEQDPDAMARVRAVLGPRTDLKLAEAQRVLAREYGFPSWARLRSHVQASRGIRDAVDAFLAAVEARDAEAALDVLRTHPDLASSSLHVAAVLGLESDVRRLIAEDASRVRSTAGASPAEPLLWLCYSPFHGESAERDAGLEACARALLDAGADPAPRDARYGIQALYAVTGERSVPRIARMLLEAGASPNDGESVFHAAERYHEDALELLRAFGVDLNFTGEWGNTPLYFLLNWWPVEREERVRRGLQWLLDHGADPNVPCGREQENSLHVAVRRGQSARIVRRLIDHGADVHARRADGRTAWVLAERGGFDELKGVLAEHGAEAESLSPSDLLLAACSRGDAERAQRFASPELLDTLEPAERQLLVGSAREGRLDVVRACLAAGFPVDTLDEQSATALHHACIAGHAAVVAELLRHGADVRIRDREHRATPLGWATFGADFMAEPGADYAGCVRALLEAGVRPVAGDHPPRDAAVSDVLRSFGVSWSQQASEKPRSDDRERPATGQENPTKPA